jgi:cytidylate kinase
MRITVSGPPGSGTTSLAAHLAKRHEMALISAGEVFRMLAKERGMELAAFGRLAEEDESVDRMIDARQKEMGESQDNIIIEGRLAGWMVGNADLRILVNAPLACRAVRIAEREGLDPAESEDLTAEREESEATRYFNYYGIDLNDLSIYDLVISSEKWGKEELAGVVDLAVGLIKV